MRTYRCGEGTVDVDDDGLVVGARHPAHPGLNAVLDDSVWWFGPDWRWGTGFLLTDAGSGRFVRPADVAFDETEVRVSYEPVPGLRLDVTRTFGEKWRERYVLRNTSTTTITIGSYAIATPIRDLYGPAAQVLREHCHAHVWTGGAESWLAAVRMDGTPPALALDLTEGELWAYSIAGRHQATSSNVRGVISLHATDHARAPHAFGGQPELRLTPGQELPLGWEIGWYDDIPAALAGHRATVSASALAAPVGTPITISTPDGPATKISTDDHQVSHVDVRHADGRQSRVAVLHHTPLEELVRRRVRTLLDHHRASERSGSRAAAFVPYDTERGLRVAHDLGWSDWSDARERIGMPQLLLEARTRGWCDNVAEVDQALLAYKEFCLEHIIKPDHRVSDGSTSSNTARLYNHPWLAQLFADLSATYGDPEDLTRAVGIIDSYYANGGEKFLAIGIAEAVLRAAHLCEESGRVKDALRLRDHLIGHARAVVALGADLPAHEVAYEQSMTAPLLSILEGAWRIEPSTSIRDAMRTVLPWLLAFAGAQPHVRLRNVPIRHWDGYWFGRSRLYGDTFPHYWSVLSGRALLDYPEDVELPDLSRARALTIAQDVLLANLVDFTADGHASCAFIFPSAVDDQPGYFADPLANDQDMGLALLLRPGMDGRTPLSHAEPS
ncbi:hypothetical protein [Actinopolymorpha alba]|uniref:hypothetical protein n=1 Tax=Actinopolymorpha alba TaxID=533267 RepID=UPI00036E4B4D|nr:hypothetical protein [Actinopolymorpha alba]